MLALLLSLAVLCGARSPEARLEHFRAGDGTTLAYFEARRGPAVVLLAGGYGLSHLYLSPVGDRLAERFRVIMPDQRGTGLSKLREYTPAALNLDKLTGDLEALRKHLGLRKLRLLGHSWGGMLAMSYAAAHPAQVESMVLVDSGGMNLEFSAMYSAGTASRLKAVLSPDEQKRLEALMTGPPPMTEATKDEISRIRLAAFLFHRDRAEELERYFRRDPIDEREASLIVDDLKSRRWDVRAELRSLRAPVLIVHGREDPMPLSVAEETARTIPGARLEVIDDCGHYPWVDQPDRFFALVLGFAR
ncbi:MAG TPA: alpha/beta fold hydrolase [Bryobacteraceae bacterium]|nr:alpha/beta fold hydrolase [Bryobacteraceae bacterium]